MNAVLTHPDAVVRVEESDGKLAILVEPRAGLFTPTKQWVTSYPLGLIKHVLEVKGPDYLCDEIMRDEYPLYIQHHLRWDLLSYINQNDFVGRRVLDFGSGSGASSMVLARLLPETTIVGVELLPELIELARHRAKFYGVEDRVSFHSSPDASGLPLEIGEFDYVVFSAVYEHLLPAERTAILSLLWSHLKPGGVMFIDQTPYRWFPIEMHTTGLPLINYFPDGLAHRYACRFSKRLSPNATWSELLRMGIRGGTIDDIMAILQHQGGSTELLRPMHLGVKDDIDLWYKVSSTTQQPLIKTLMMWGFRAVKAVTGVTIVPSLALAVRKVR